MAIGPSGMGGGPPMGPPPGMGRGPDLPTPGGVPSQPGGDVMAAKQRLMQIAAEAESILSKHPELAQELMGGGGVGGAAVGGVGGMPQMPVAANTGARRGGNAASRGGIDATNSAMGMGRGLIA